MRLTGSGLERTLTGPALDFLVFLVGGKVDLIRVFIHDLTGGGTRQQEMRKPIKENIKDKHME